MADIEVLTIGPGSKVTMHFTLSLKDGTVADSTEEGEPMTFTMGDGTLIEGLEMVLYGLKVGDKQCLEIGPRDTFGFPEEDNIHTLPRSEFAAEFHSRRVSFWASARLPVKRCRAPYTKFAMRRSWSTLIILSPDGRWSSMWRFWTSNRVNSPRTVKHESHTCQPARLLRWRRSCH